MRRILLTSASLLAITMISAAQTPASPTTLAQLRHDFRPLLLFAPRPDDPSLLAQLHELKDDAPGLTSRQVLLIAIPFNNPSPTGTSLTPSDALAARRRFHVARADFSAILLGKDGGEKLRSANPSPSPNSATPSTPCPCASRRSTRTPRVERIRVRRSSSPQPFSTSSPQGTRVP